MRQGESEPIHRRRSPRPVAARPASLLILAAICALGVLSGCGDSPSTGHWRVVERLSEPPDAELFSLADVTRELVVRSWRLAEPDQAALWRVEPLAAKGPIDRRGQWLRTLEPADPQPVLTAAVELDAEQITALELRLRNPSRAASEIRWAGAGQELSSERSMSLEQSDPARVQGPIRVLRFEVKDHPRWRGPIRRLQIRPAIGSRRDFAVVSVRALRARLDDDLRRSATSRSWKVDLASTIREARVAFPGHPWKTRLAVPDAKTVLRFVPGLPASLDGRVNLAVRAVAADGAETELFSRTYSGGVDRWQEPVELSLEELASQELELIFGLDGGGADDGFAAWANVRLESRDTTPPPPNVVLICLDTLRADHLSAYGYGRQTSPRIDRWAAERAVLFEQAVAPAPWTLPSFISIFTGLDPIRHGANYHLPARSGLEMLAEVLARRGYETAAWTGGAYLGPGHALHQGFESFTYHLGGKQSELAENTARVVDWLDAPRERPFFLLFHTYEAHSPYLERQPFYDAFAASSGAPPIPSGWVSPKRLPRSAQDGFKVSRELMMSPDRGANWQALSADLRASVVDRYDSGVSYADEQIGKLLDALDRRDRAANSVVILTSDHGEGLGEHGLSGHSYLYDFNLMVPLIIAAPPADWPAGGRVRRQVRSVDIAPTVLDIVGLEAESEMDGESLTPLALGRPGATDRLAWSYAAIANRGVSLRLPDVKYLFNNTASRPIFAREKLRDLRRDPTEVDDDSANRAEETARYRDLVTGRLARQAVAVWFDLRSGEQHALTVELSGAEIADPSRLKAMALPGDGIRYAGTPPERAVIELPPGTKALLYSEARATDRVQLDVSWARPGIASRRWRLKLEKVAAKRWSAGATDGAWSEAPAGARSPGPFLSVFVSHDLGRAAEPAKSNRQLEEQLRALGYLQ